MLHFRPDLTSLSNSELSFENEMLLGGDMRIALDPATGRNVYGVPPRPEQRETWLSSSTAAPITTRGFCAAANAFERWKHGADDMAFGWAESVRHRLLRLFGIPGAEAVLCPSGTDAELVVLALALDQLGPAITNIILAPGETGRGVPLAAAGRHTSSRTPLGAASISASSPVSAFSADVEVEAVEIRTSDGRAREPNSIDASVFERASKALQRGRGVVLHCLDVSKTGLSAYPLDAIAALTADTQRCLVVVDACQLRCPAQRIRDALTANQIVIVTGSKFAGGPPFSGAVLLPPELACRLPHIRVPGGMRDYSALADWPNDARSALQASLNPRGNTGLLLRWEAAIAELEPLCSVPDTIRDAVATRFHAAVAGHVSATPGLSLLDCQTNMESSRTIVPVVTSTYHEELVPGAYVQKGLAQRSKHPIDAWQDHVFRVGQPVAIGQREPVRICLSAPQLLDIAERIQAGDTVEQAFLSFDKLLSGLFAKWVCVRSQASGAGALAK